MMVGVGPACAVQPLRMPAQNEVPPRAIDLSVNDRLRIVNLAHHLEGKRYAWDKNGPEEFDCSGFVHYVLQESLGKFTFDLPYDLADMPGYSAQSLYYRDFLRQRKARLKSCQDAKPGDIVFFPQRGNEIQHIGIVSSKVPSKFITAQTRKKGVREEPYYEYTYWGDRSPECYRNVWVTEE